jgi:hypothetical protein
LSIPGFPDVSGGTIGDADGTTNGGVNPNEGRTQADRQQGFANLLEAALNAAFAEARAICRETYAKPPCCKEVKITFNGVGARDGEAGNDELQRRLSGTKNNLNKPPINGVFEGKTWRVNCKEMIE